MGNLVELRRRLIEALTVLGKTNDAQLVRERGKPVSNPFFWPDPELGDAEVELFSLVKDGWDSEWVIDDRSIQRYIRQLTWDALSELGAAEQIPGAVDTFLAKITIKLARFTVLAAIEGLRPEKSPVQIGNVRIGILDDLVDQKTAKEIVVSSGGKTAVWAHLEVTAPSEKHVADAATRGVEEALDLLATLDQRSRMTRGNPGEIRLGSFGFVLSDSGPWQFGFGNEWLRGVGYSVDPETAVDKHPSYRTGPLPWYDLSPQSELSEALKEAYRRFGHACRLREDPEAAIPLAVSAIESLLSEKDDKRFSTAGRVILASAALDQPTMWPLALVGWFERRNEILHEPSQLTWNAEEASRAFRSLYGVLDLIASFILEEKLGRREDLLVLLSSLKNVEAAKKAVETQVLRLKNLREKALTEAYRRELGEAIGTWEAIRKGLKAAKT